jgi:hypothetical protein
MGTTKITQCVLEETSLALHALPPASADPKRRRLLT